MTHGDIPRHISKPQPLDRGELPGQVVMVMQGGGAPGVYQAGAYEALHDAGIEPDWVIGTSIGAINGVHHRRQSGRAAGRTAPGVLDASSQPMDRTLESAGAAGLGRARLLLSQSHAGPRRRRQCRDRTRGPVLR